MERSADTPGGPVHDRIRTYRDYRDFLAADLAAHGTERWTLSTYLRRPQLRYQRVLRLVEFLSTRRDPAGRAAYVLARLRLARLSLLTGISIPPGVFGRGLSIAHYGSIVVNDQVRVGAYCRLHSATNIGVHLGKAPVLGDYVYVGPGAVIYGGIEIGSQSTVGANAVVGRSVPASSVVAGAPARVVSTRSSLSAMPEWIQRHMPEPSSGGGWAAPVPAAGGS